MPFKKSRLTSPIWALLAATVLLLPSGCSSSKSTTGKSYIMGEPAVIGPLTYTIMESEWKEALDGSLGQRLPKHRFVAINLSVHNKSAAEVSVPFLTLIDVNGTEFREETNAEGVVPTLGYLRRVEPAATLSGRVLFDVPPGGYKLRISSGGDAETEQTAVVDIPYRADPPPVKGVDPMAVPSTK